MLKVEEAEGEAPLLNIFGGKLTTYRRLAEHALEKIGAAIGEKGKPWTAGSHLPGGDFGAERYEAQVRALVSRYPFLDGRHAERLVRNYGTKAAELLGGATDVSGLGGHFGGTLYECEVRWLVEHEWASAAEDILWRRTKQGLRLSKEEAAGLDEFVAMLTGGEQKAEAVAERA